MAKKKTFTTILQKTVKGGTLPTNVYASREWFREKSMQVRSLREGDTQRILKIGRQNKRMKPALRGRMMLGKMFMFEYDPITAEETLERGGYYDIFPCVFPINPLEDGFLGINMHYLPYTWRAILMDNLYNLVQEPENLTEQSRLKLPMDGYNFLKKSAKYRYFVPCIRKYLFTRAMSRYMEVPATEWEIALFLPLERFQGDTRRKIWMDTRKKYRRSIQRGF